MTAPSPRTFPNPFDNGHGFVPGLVPPEADTPALHLTFQDGRLLLTADGQPAGQQPGSEGELYLGQQTVDGAEYAVWTARLAGEAPAGTVWRPLRSQYGRLPEWLWALAGYAVQLTEWDRTHRYCGYCGALTVREGHEHARRCPSCGLSVYPRLAPAVMVLLTRTGEHGQPQVLLCRSPRFPAGMYSANAGFVEPGETVEHAAHREMYEETGLYIQNLRYFDSQPWPFPHSLMLAYTAEYAGGEIAPQDGEIEEARWFDHGALPQLPGHASISRRLIESVVGRVDQV